MGREIEKVTLRELLDESTAAEVEGVDLQVRLRVQGLKLSGVKAMAVLGALYVILRWFNLVP